MHLFSNAKTEKQPNKFVCVFKQILGSVQSVFEFSTEKKYFAKSTHL